MQELLVYVELLPSMKPEDGRTEQQSRIWISPSVPVSRGGNSFTSEICRYLFKFSLCSTFLFVFFFLIFCFRFQETENKNTFDNYGICVPCDRRKANFLVLSRHSDFSSTDGPVVLQICSGKWLWKSSETR